MKPDAENLHAIIIRQLACSIHLDNFSYHVLSQKITGCNARKANQKLVYFCMNFNHKIYKLIEESNLDLTEFQHSQNFASISEVRASP